MKKWVVIVFLFLTFLGFCCACFTGCTSNKDIPTIAKNATVQRDTLVAHKAQLRNHFSKESIGAAGLLNSVVIPDGFRKTAVTSPTPVKLPLLNWNDSAQTWVAGINANYGNRINIVIIADGYVHSKYDSLKSLNDSKAIISAFKIRAPLSWYFNRFSFYVIYAQSHDSGIGQTSNTCGSIVAVNNYFGSFMGFQNICRYSNYNATAVNNVLAGTMPYYDIPIVLVNSPVYAGGADGSVAQATSNTLSTEIIVHEIGHCFGMGDEYNYGGCGYIPCWNALSTQDTAYARTLWGDTWVSWLPGDGKQTGADYCPQGLRDSANCEMNNLSQPFCPQCKKRLIYAFHYYTSDIDGFYPSIGISKTSNFSIKILQPVSNTVKVVWSANGSVKQIGGNTFTPSAGTYSSISVTAQDTTKWLFKTKAPIFTQTWNNITVTGATPPPAAPIGLTTGNGQTVVLTCFATTGATHYTFTLNTGANAISSTPSATFTGLTAKTAYSCTVTVTTANGTSAASIPFNFATP